MTYNPLNGMGCRNDDACEGGYRRVSDRYIEVVAPLRPLPYPDNGMPPADGCPPELAVEWAKRDAANTRTAVLDGSARAAAANSSFPCPNCNPDQFIRWQRGEWPYPPRAGSTRPIANEPDAADEASLLDLTIAYSPPIPDEDF